MFGTRSRKAVLDRVTTTTTVHPPPPRSRSLFERAPEPRAPESPPSFIEEDDADDSSRSEAAEEEDVYDDDPDEEDGPPDAEDAEDGYDDVEEVREVKRKPPPPRTILRIKEEDEDKNLDRVEKEKRRALSQGMFSAAGVGTYIFLGKTNSGKNYMLEHAIRHAFARTSITWENIVVFSRTAKLSGNYDFMKDMVGPGHFAIIGSLETLYGIVAHRSKTVEKMKKSLKNSHFMEWLKGSSVLMILDDFAGFTNVSSSSNNPLFNLVSTARHLGIWLCILSQYNKIIGPAYWQNCRAVVSFDTSGPPFKSLIEHIHDEVKDLPMDTRRFLQRYPGKKKYQFLIWWNFWNGFEKPTLPWMMLPVEEGEYTLKRSELQDKIEKQ